MLPLVAIASIMRSASGVSTSALCSEGSFMQKI
jgi:hypothetical protein